MVAPIGIHLLDQYTQPDSESGAGEFDLVHRLAATGKGEVKDFTPFDWCTYYFALRDGTFCVRERADERPQIRRIRQRAESTMPWVDSLVHDAIMRPLDDQHGLLLGEAFRGGSVECLTFEVASATGDSAHVRRENGSFLEQRGKTLWSGLRCRFRGRSIVGMPFLTDTFIYPRFWDRVGISGRTFWLIETEYDGCSWLDVLLQRRDSVRSIASRFVGCD